MNEEEEEEEEDDEGKRRQPSKINIPRAYAQILFGGCCCGRTESRKEEKNGRRT